MERVNKIEILVNPQGNVHGGYCFSMIVAEADYDVFDLRGMMS